MRTNTQRRAGRSGRGARLASSPAAPVLCLLCAIALLGAVSMPAVASAQVRAELAEVWLSDDAAFVELENVGTTAFSASLLWLASDVQAAHLPSGEVGTTSAVRLPALSVPPGERLILSIGDPEAFIERFGFSPDISVERRTGVPLATPVADGGSRLAPSAESGFLWLFTWDGRSDLVRDVDYVRWGNGAVLDRTGLEVDGPDEGSEPSSYAPDLDADVQASLASMVGRAAVRVAPGAVGQGTGGNGLAGADETSERFGETWELLSAPSPLGPLARGTVSFANGQPAPGARVVSSIDETRTSSDGSFGVRVDSIGEELRIERDGYLDVSATAQDEPLEITLERSATIRGVARLIDRPAPTASIVVNFGDDVEPVEVMSGEPFEIHGVPAGTYDVEVLADGFAGAALSVEAEPVASFDVVLWPDRLVTLRGTATSPAGRPLTGAGLALFGGPLDDARVGETGADGSFQFEGLHAGFYRLEITDGAHGRQTFDAIDLLRDATTTHRLVDRDALPEVTVLDDCSVAARRPAPLWWCWVAGLVALFRARTRHG